MIRALRSALKKWTVKMKKNTFFFLAILGNESTVNCKK
jgi:ribosomal protein L10